MSKEEQEQLPSGRRQPSPHDVPPRTIAIIVGVMVVGLGVGMLLVLPHYGPRKPRHRSALGHVMPMSMIGRETNGMVWVPGGLFIMGSDQGKPDEAPPHEVNVAPVWMDKTEVTNEQFSKFVEETGYVTLAEQSKTNRATWRHPRGPASSIAGLEMHPVVQVAWTDAVAFAQWAGKRLPTEAEWEHAARGGLDRQNYPWGSEPPTRLDPRANLGFERTNTLAATLSVGGFGPNGYSLLDMSGNVAEWCSDRYGSDYYKNSPNLNPKGPGESDGDLRVIRGGSFLSSENGKGDYRTSARSFGPATLTSIDLGFRCVRDGF